MEFFGCWVTISGSLCPITATADGYAPRDPPPRGCRWPSATAHRLSRPHLRRPATRLVVRTHRARTWRSLDGHCPRLCTRGHGLALNVHRTAASQPELRRNLTRRYSTLTPDIRRC